MKDQISIRKVVVFCVSLTVSIILSICLYPCISQNSKITELFITLFSILAGVLVAVITVAGDPASFYPGTWRIAYYQKEEIYKRLVRQAVLFYAYLLTLGLIFISYIVENAMPCMTKPITIGYSCIGFMAFIYSWSLPKSLIRIQTEKLDAMIENRKENREQI